MNIIHAIWSVEVKYFTTYMVEAKFDFTNKFLIISMTFCNYSDNKFIFKLFETLIGFSSKIFQLILTVF
jgi:hypothetical protein